MPSIYEIARGADVSPATVSRALNPELRHKVKSQTLEKILKYCQEHDYYGTLAAKSLASGKTYCIGLVLESVENDFASPFFAVMLRGVIDALELRGYRLKIITVPHGAAGNTDHDVRKAMLGNEVDGFLLSAAMIGEETIRELRLRKCPAVVFVQPNADKIPEGVAALGIDNASGFAGLAAYWRECGMTRIAVIGNMANEPRTLTLQQEAAKHGLKITEFVIPELCCGVMQETFGMYTMVIRHWEELRQYQAWHCVSDLWALGAANALRQLAPESDIFISGYDNVEENPNYRLQGKALISTIDIPLIEMGRQAVEMLFAPERTESFIKLPTRFILRKK